MYIFDLNKINIILYVCNVASIRINISMEAHQDIKVPVT